MKICKWCKKPFEPNAKHKKYCCVKCAKNGFEKKQREYRIENKEKIRERERKQYMHKISYCKICGVKLPHGRQQYCLDCLLKDYIKAKEECKKGHNHLITAYSRLNSRGLDKEMIEGECKERGII